MAEHNQHIKMLEEMRDEERRLTSKTEFHEAPDFVIRQHKECADAIEYALKLIGEYRELEAVAGKIEIGDNLLVNDNRFGLGWRVWGQTESHDSLLFAFRSLKEGKDGK